MLLPSFFFLFVSLYSSFSLVLGLLLLSSSSLTLSLLLWFFFFFYGWVNNLLWGKVKGLFSFSIFLSCVFSSVFFFHPLVSLHPLLLEATLERNSILIFLGLWYCVKIKIGPEFDRIGTPTVLPLLACWWWVFSTLEAHCEGTMS